jgi:ADP-ribose pyrophosphatase
MNATALKLMHAKCRGAYPGASVTRSVVPDQQVSWQTAFTDYAPTLYTAPVVASGPVWADKDFLTDKAATAAIKWNDVDGKIDRRSFEGDYKLDEHGVPQNPLGRTGMRGRGLLGRFGPNHAADPIVTRYVSSSVIPSISFSQSSLAIYALKRKNRDFWIAT